MKNEIIIIGAGGHAKVVLDAIKKQGVYVVKGFCVDTLTVGEKIGNEYLVLGDTMLTNLKADSSVYFVVAIGDNKARGVFYENAKKKFSAATIIHPTAAVGSNVSIGVGSVVLANAVINPHTIIGDNCIVSAGVLIDHDCKIGNHVHLSLGTVVGSKSEIGNSFTSSFAEKIESGSKR